MRQSTCAVCAALATSAYAATHSTSSLTDVCTVANVQAALPANNTILGQFILFSAPAFRGRHGAQPCVTLLKCRYGGVLMR